MELDNWLCSKNITIKLKYVLLSIVFSKIKHNYPKLFA